MFPIIERMKIDRKITQITMIGRKNLCLGNGINKNFLNKVFIDHNVFYDPRFSPTVPVIQDIRLDGQTVIIKGFRLGFFETEIESVIIKSQICQTVKVIKPDEELNCWFNKL